MDASSRLLAFFFKVISIEKLDKDFCTRLLLDNIFAH